MELWQAGINTFVGFVVMGVTELLKRWAVINLPIIKYILVLAISAGFGILLGWLYGVDMTASELVRQSMVIALSAIGVKSLSKPGD